MPIQLINIGVLPNDGTGDPLRVAFEKINNNFAELSVSASAAAPDGSIQFRDTNDFTAVGQLGANYVAFAYPGKFYRSTDGVTWTTDSLPSNVPNVIYTRITTAGGNLVAVGTNGTVVFTDDLTTWLNVSPVGIQATTETLYGVANDGTTNWAVVGGNGAIRLSTNIATNTSWTTPVSTGANTFYDVVYGVNEIGWTAVGAGGVVANSFGAWTQTQVMGISTNLNSIAYTPTDATGNFVYVVVGGDGTTLYNNTGISFTTVNSGTTSNLTDVAVYTDGNNYSWTAVGSNSTIITSNLANANSWTLTPAAGVISNYNEITIEGSTITVVGTNGTILTKTAAALTWTNSSIQGVLNGSTNLIYDDVNSNLLLGANIIPTKNNISIGTANAPFKELYVAGNSLHIGNITESQTNNNTLTFSLDSNVSNLANIEANGINGQVINVFNANVTNSATVGNLLVTGNANIPNIVTGSNLIIGNVLVSENPDLTLQFLNASNTAQAASITAFTITGQDLVSNTLTSNNSIIGNTIANTIAATSLSANVVTVNVAINASNANLTANVITANVGNIADINSNNIVANSLTVNGGTIANGNITANNFIANSQVIADGNITSSNGYFVGNGYYLTGTSRASGPVNSIQYATPDGSGNFTFASEATFIYDSTTNTLEVDNINSTGNSILGNTVVNTLSTTGDVSANNLSAIGNLSANNVLANTNITSNGTIGALGNVTGANLVANTSVITDSLRHSNLAAWTAQDFPGAYSNANVANYLPTFNGNISANNIVATGNINANTFNGVFIGPLTGNVNGDVVGDLTGDSFGTHTGPVIGNTQGTHTGPVIGNVTGNVSGNLSGNVVGESATITTITAGNVNGRLVGNSIGTHTGPVIGNVTGNVSGNLTGATVTLTGAITAASANITANITAGNVYSNTGTIGANLLTGTLTTNAQPNINQVGNLIDANIITDLYVGNLSNTGSLIVRSGTTLGGNVTIAGNLVVSGNTTYANTSSLVVEDPIIEQGGGPNGAPLTVNDGKDRGILQHYYTTTPVDAFIGWKNTSGEFIMGSNVTDSNSIITVNTYGNLRINTLFGNVSGATGTFTGNVSAANITASNINVSGVITGNGSGLTGLPVQTLTAGGNITLSNNAGNWTITAALVSPAAGNAGEVQFANTAGDGNFQATSGFTFDPITNTLTTSEFVGNLTGNVNGNLTGNVNGNIGGVNGSFTGNLQSNNFSANVITGSNIIGTFTGNISGNTAFFDEGITAQFANITANLVTSNANVANTLRTNVTIGNLLTINTSANLANIIIANTTVYATNDTLYLTGIGNVELYGNDYTGDDTTVRGGDASNITNYQGGNLILRGGAASRLGLQSGNVTITGGQVDWAGVIPGNIAILGGNGNAANGGVIRMVGGYATGPTTFGGNIEIITGNGVAGNGKLILNRLTFPDLGGNTGELLALDGNNNIVYRTASSYSAGTNTQVQFNDNGNTNASAGFTFNKLTNTVSIANSIFIGNSIANATILNITANTTLNTPDQTLATWSNTAWRSAVFQIDADDSNGNIQYIRVNATRAGNGLAVTYTMTDARKGGSNWLSNYAMDYSSGNFRLLATPTLNTTVTHNINVEYLN